MSRAGQQQTGREDQGSKPNPADLDLIDGLVDADKDEEELWAEADAEDAAANTKEDGSDAAPDGAQSDDDEFDKAAATEVSADDDSSDKGDGGDSPDDQGRQKAKDGQSPDDQAGTDDPWASAPKALRDQHDAELAELERLRKAEDGHRRHIKGLTKKVRDLEDGGGRDRSEIDSQSDEGLKKVEEEYPELSALVAEVRDLRKGQARAEEDRSEAYLDQQESLLNEAHSDWLSVTADKAFADWIEVQPGYVQKVIADNAKSIVNAKDAADVIGRFKAFRSSQAQQQDAGEGNDGPGAEGDQGTGNDDLSGRRARQRRSASSARSTGPGTASGIPKDGDEEAIWRQMDAEDQRKAAATG